MPYRLSALAEQDLEEIWSYVAKDASPTTADGLVDAIIKRFELLAEQPKMGRLRPELGAGVRSFTVEKSRHLLPARCGHPHRQSSPWPARPGRRVVRTRCDARVTEESVCVREPLAAPPSSDGLPLLGDLVLTDGAANLLDRLVGRQALTRGVELLDHAVKSFHFAKAVDDHRNAEWTLDDEGRISRMEPQ